MREVFPFSVYPGITQANMSKGENNTVTREKEDAGSSRSSENDLLFHY